VNHEKAFPSSFPNFEVVRARMSFSTDSAKLQFACVFVVFLLWIITVVVVRMAQKKAPGGPNNSNPRVQYRELVRGLTEWALYIIS
jgi:hypothetical protein